MVGKRPSFRIVRYWCWSIVPSTRIEIPTPWAVIQPHILRDPPPNFRVSLIWRGFKPGFSEIQHQLHPSDPNLHVFVSSDQITLFQSSAVQFSCLLAKASRSLRFFLINIGFFFFSVALSPPSRRTLLTVLSLTRTSRSFLRDFWRSLADSHFSVLTELIQGACSLKKVLTGDLSFYHPTCGTRIFLLLRSLTCSSPIVPRHYEWKRQTTAGHKCGFFRI